MSVDIIKVYKQDLPSLRFIGKKYGDKDRVDGNFGKLWGDWFQNGWFDILEKNAGKDLKAIYEDGGAYIGLMRHKDNEPFEYWIGIFMDEKTPVPDGFEYYDFPKVSLGVCWLYGKEAEVFMQEDRCMKELEKQGHEVTNDDQGAWWFFERYGCPRFTTPDEKGNIILDICWHVK